MKTLTTDVFILGGGSAGFGACYVLTQNKINCVCADINSGFGGNAVYSGVSCFEPGVSLDGAHLILADILLNNGGGQVQKSVPSNRIWHPETFLDEFDEPLNSQHTLWALSVAVNDDYKETLKRCKKFCNSYTELRRFMTDEEYLGEAMSALISENDEYFIGLFGYRFLSCKSKDGKIISVTVTNGEESVEIKAKYFLDCSGSIIFARSAGCEYTVGNNGDLSAINGATLVLRVTKDKTRQISVSSNEDVTDWEETRMRRSWACFNMYPNGDINVNMLPTISGEELITLGDRAEEIARARAIKYWEFLQKHYKLNDYGICKTFKLAIREDYRLIGKHVLTYEDMLKGVEKDKEYIAIADHPLDSHRIGGAVHKEVLVPYGIPLECTQPKEFSNMFVVCRGSSFSHVAASSARLTRTMMSMGEGVAKYILHLQTS